MVRGSLSFDSTYGQNLSICGNAQKDTHLTKSSGFKSHQLHYSSAGDLVQDHHLHFGYLSPSIKRVKKNICLIESQLGLNERLSVKALGIYLPSINAYRSQNPDHSICTWYVFRSSEVMWEQQKETSGFKAHLHHLLAV